MKRLLLILLFLIPVTAHAAALDIRISDCDGHVLDISASGELQTSTTNESSTATSCGSDIRLSDDEGQVLDINADGTVTVASGSPS